MDKDRPPIGDLRADLAATSETIETHISWVFLRGDEVWKVKKPVSLGFLDFSTVDRRRAACEAEIRLNRRLAPEVYLGCVPITQYSRGRHEIDGAGETVDWAVHMKRLPDADRADTRLARGQLSNGQVEAIATRLAAFHARARCDAETTRFGTTEAIGVNVKENFEQSRDTISAYLDREQVEEIKTWQTRFLDTHESRFDQRCQAGRIRDGHGDLRLEHIYIDADDKIVIVDCIEFNDRFRFADVCSDIAFLAMDLAWHEHATLAEHFLASYAREANDYDLYPLVDFYESYRAFVRGKISAMVAADQNIVTAARQQAARDARRYYLLALAAERRALQPPRVIAVGGVIASGKSTLAERLANTLGAPVVDTDRTRKNLLGVAATTPLATAAFSGAYAPQQTNEVYAETLRRADAVLRSGRTVVIDASFRSRSARADAVELARHHGVPFLFVECRVTRDLARQRLRERAREASVSDGRLEIFEHFVAAWQPADEFPTSEHLVLDTALAPESNLERILEHLDMES